MTSSYVRRIARPLLLAGVLLALPVTFRGPVTGALPSVEPSDACGENVCCVPETYSVCVSQGLVNFHEYTQPGPCHSTGSAQIP
jgi:hypothetical protein